jgi:3-methyladenine DNA glycosylase Tag
MWVGGVYETLRLLNERKLAPNSDEYRALFHDFELLRIALDKHDIARLLKAPLQMIRNNDQTNVYVFTKDDPQRPHIMAVGVAAHGSMVWQVIDWKSDAARWIERRSLSDRMIALWIEQGSLKAD